MTGNPPVQISTDLKPSRQIRVTTVAVSSKTTTVHSPSDWKTMDAMPMPRPSVSHASGRPSPERRHSTMRRIKLHITDELLEKSKADVNNGNAVSNACVIAQAMSTALGQPITVSTCEYRGEGVSLEHHLLPTRVVGYITQFDNWVMLARKKPEPCTFIIEVPDVL
jgi:hypothetical protein